LGFGQLIETLEFAAEEEATEDIEVKEAVPA
jgi:hypothetical protein